MSGGELLRVAVVVPPEQTEEARAAFLALAPQGFEERAAGERLEIAAYVDASGAERIERRFAGASVERVEPGWEDAWRAFHRPARVGPLWIGPPWEVPDAGAVPVVIDPGRAFGTGAHATTRLALELLAGLEPGSLADLGCGSGVLAIAGAKLGFAPVVALDSDPAAVAATRANAAANGVTIRAEQADVLADALPATAVAVANIALEAVELLGPRVEAPLLVTSGYLERDRPALPGRTALERRTADGWAADLFGLDEAD